MLTRRIAALSIFLSLASSYNALADSPRSAERLCGIVAYFDGSATLTHKGKASPLDLGMPIRNNDMVRTGEGSRVEIAMDASTGFSGTIIVSPKTVFYFRLSELENEASTSLDLMGGQLGMKVQKLSGIPSIQVRTHTAVCGVRGTEFAVAYPPTGNVCVACDRGKVAFLGLEGDSVDVGPDAEDCLVAQRREGERVAKLPFEGSDTGAELDKWFSSEMQALRSNPAKALGQFAGYYLKRIPAFDAAWASLGANEVLKRWMAEDADPNFEISPMSQENFRDSKALAGPIIAIRKELFLLERYLYRIDEIRGLLADSPGWKAPLSIDGSGAEAKASGKRAITPEAFYKSYDAARAGLEAKIGLYRYAELLHQLHSPFGGAER